MGKPGWTDSSHPCACLLYTSALLGRVTSGVKLMNLDEGVTVASMAKVREDKSIIENQNEEESAEEEYSEENKEVSEEVPKEE